MDEKIKNMVMIVLGILVTLNLWLTFNTRSDVKYQADYLATIDTIVTAQDTMINKQVIPALRSMNSNIVVNTDFLFELARYDLDTIVTQNIWSSIANKYNLGKPAADAK